MNQQEVAKRVRELYDVPNDVCVQDYLNDLESSFEPTAYANITDAGLIEDVETYREYVCDYYLDPTPHFTEEGDKHRGVTR